MNDILIIGRRNYDFPNPERKQLIVKYFQNQAKNYFHLCLLEAALSAGASSGSVISGWIHLSPNETNVVILGGMVAFLTGITRAPFTSTIIVLEMTDRHSLIFHLMLAGMVSSLISVMVSKKSLYDLLKNSYLEEIRNEDKLEKEAKNH